MARAHVKQNKLIYSLGQYFFFLFFRKVMKFIILYFIATQAHKEREQRPREISALPMYSNKA